MPKKYREDAVKDSRDFLLIVCEGLKTEPQYFEAIQINLPKNVVQVETIGGCGNTLTLIKEAKKINDERIILYGVPYDEIYLVFDRDSFPEERFNNAVFSAESNNMEPIYSNEAFELWYLLHFEYCNSGIDRKQYITKLKNYLGSYKKNDPEIYGKLLELGNQNNAMKWAQKLYDLYDHKNPVDEKPSTRVHILVAKLLSYISED